MSLAPLEAHISPALPGFRSERPFSVRVAIIHGNRMCGELLHQHCGAMWGCEVVALEFSGPAGVEAVEKTKPDILLLGHTPPLVDATEIVPLCHRACAAAKILVSARRLSEYLVHHLAHSSVHAVVEESTEGLAFVQMSLQHIRCGGRFFSPRFVHLQARLRSSPDAFPKLLSLRQEAVLVCIAHAMDDPEIARTLGMSVGTAQRHRADIMRKLNLHGTPRLIRYCRQAGFDEISPASLKIGKAAE